MKDLRHYRRFRRLVMHQKLVIIGLSVVLSMTSCNKISQLAGKLKNVGADSHTTVDRMNHEQAKAVIDGESKLVMVEFYSDT